MMSGPGDRQEKGRLNRQEAVSTKERQPNRTDANHFVLTFENNRLASELFGQFDQNLKLIEDRLGIDARARGNTVAISGAAPVEGFGKPTTKPALIYRADGSRASTLDPGLTHRLALVVEEQPSRTARQATVSMRELMWVGKGGLASNLDEDYWLVLDNIDRRGTITIGPAPAVVTR